MRRLLLLSSVVIVVAALALVPLPWVELAPGPALDVRSRLEVDRPPAHEPSGHLLLTTVLLGDATSFDAVDALVDPHRELVARQDVIPPGVNEGDYLAAQQQVFVESGQVAAAVAAREAGLPVTVTGGGAVVAAVATGSPADGKLREGDVITAVDGRPVHLASDLVSRLAAVGSGTVVTLTVRRAGRARSVGIRLRRASQLGRPRLGVAIETLDLRVRLPFHVGIRGNDIGGPSAGLMMALTVYDLLQPTDLTRGRTIAGTGTIDVDGRVGPIGGIREKVVGARRAGATLFLAPVSEAGDARDAAPKGLRVVPVSTFDEAVAALRR
jgi:PDZ domain-containing protein